jgi:hypothetical protein
VWLAAWRREACAVVQCAHKVDGFCYSMGFVILSGIVNMPRQGLRIVEVLDVTKRTEWSGATKEGCVLR